MFESTVRPQSNAEYARSRTASRTQTAEAQWHREAETWFDGTVDSVDRRLKVCDRILASTRARLANDGLGADAGRRLANMADFEQARTALTNLRSDILSGSEWRHEAAAVAPSPEHVSRLLAQLHSEDRRYVELEAAKVIRNNPGCEFTELAGRAWRQASAETSRFGKRRSDLIADAMAARVYQLARRTRPSKRTATTVRREIPDYPAELMFL